jgi:hypothetical protein
MQYKPVNFSEKLGEPRGVRNTGHEASERTAENDVWV